MSTARTTQELARRSCRGAIANGTRCGCDQRCTCHPPLMSDEQVAGATARGSFHLESCPAFPRTTTVDVKPPTRARRTSGNGDVT